MYFLNLTVVYNNKFYLSIYLSTVNPLVRKFSLNINISIQTVNFMLKIDIVSILKETHNPIDKDNKKLLKKSTF